MKNSREGKKKKTDRNNSPEAILDRFHYSTRVFWLNCSVEMKSSAQVHHFCIPAGRSPSHIWTNKPITVNDQVKSCQVNLSLQNKDNADIGLKYPGPPKGSLSEHFPLNKGCYCYRKFTQMST